jgi:hypothetical protein
VSEHTIEGRGADAEVSDDDVPHTNTRLLNIL